MCVIPVSVCSDRTILTAAAFSSGEYRRVVGFPAVCSVDMNFVLDFRRPSLQPPQDGSFQACGRSRPGSGSGPPAVRALESRRARRSLPGGRPVLAHTSFAGGGARRCPSSGSTRAGSRSCCASSSGSTRRRSSGRRGAPAAATDAWCCAARSAGCAHAAVGRARTARRSRVPVPGSGSIPRAGHVRARRGPSAAPAAALDAPRAPARRSCATCRRRRAGVGRVAEHPPDGGVVPAGLAGPGRHALLGEPPGVGIDRSETTRRQFGLTNVCCRFRPTDIDAEDIASAIASNDPSLGLRASLAPAPEPGDPRFRNLRGRDPRALHSLQAGCLRRPSPRRARRRRPDARMWR